MQGCGPCRWTTGFEPSARAFASSFGQIGALAEVDGRNRQRARCWHKMHRDWIGPSLGLHDEPLLYQKSNCVERGRDGTFRHCGSRACKPGRQDVDLCCACIDGRSDRRVVDDSAVDQLPTFDLDRREHPWDRSAGKHSWYRWTGREPDFVTGHRVSGDEHHRDLRILEQPEVDEASKHSPQRRVGNEVIGPAHERSQTHGRMQGKDVPTMEGRPHLSETIKRSTTRHPAGVYRSG
jgi:hypothetical protein